MIHFHIIPSKKRLQVNLQEICDSAGKSVFLQIHTQPDIADKLRITRVEGLLGPGLFFFANTRMI